MPGGLYWNEALMQMATEAPSVLALGDSWFWYPKNNLLPPIHRYSESPTILAKGGAGMEAAEFTHPNYFKDFRQCLKDYGFTRAALLSGGGNDFAGIYGPIASLKENYISLWDASKCFKEGDPDKLLHERRGN